jgi:Flp pilus assembly pilin Flp
MKSFLRDEEGLTTVEYALLLALLVVAAVGVWTTFGSQVKSSVSTSSNAIGNAMTG